MWPAVWSKTGLHQGQNPGDSSEHVLAGRMQRDHTVSRWRKEEDGTHVHAFEGTHARLMPDYRLDVRGFKTNGEVQLTSLSLSEIMTTKLSGKTPSLPFISPLHHPGSPVSCNESNI